MHICDEVKGGNGRSHQARTVLLRFNPLQYTNNLCYLEVDKTSHVVRKEKGRNATVDFL